MDSTGRGDDVLSDEIIEGGDVLDVEDRELMCGLAAMEPVSFSFLASQRSYLFELMSKFFFING